MKLDYLLKKLAEEAGEVTAAAIKHSLHRDQASKDALEGEMADVLALVHLTSKKLRLDAKRVVNLMEARVEREKAKG